MAENSETRGGCLKDLQSQKTHYNSLEFLKIILVLMAKGKRSYVAYYSPETGNVVHTTHIQKKNFEAGTKGPELRKYNPKTRKHETLKMKEIKKG